MRLINKRLLVKYTKKHRGNAPLIKAVSQLIIDLESHEYNSSQALKLRRTDMDRVHAQGFYLFDLSDHRTMILLEFSLSEATIVWCGNHKEYELTFKNNKTTIQKWLRKKNWI